MPTDVLISGTKHQEQGEEYLCGPACIRMVLSLWNQTPSMDQLWAEVQANSGTQLRPPIPWEDGSFSNQVCDLCTDGGYDCWFTTPEAMTATINTHSSPHALKSDYVSSEDVIRRIADSVSASPRVPAAFTTQPSLHWVVAVGYQLDGSGDSVMWNGSKVTGLYVRDPIGSDQWPDTTQFVTIAGLFEPIAVGLLMAVECGTHKNLYPVVFNAAPSGGGGGGGGQGGGGGATGVVAGLWTSFLRFAYRPWRYFFPNRNPRDPRPPPPTEGR